MGDLLLEKKLKSMEEGRQDQGRWIMVKGMVHVRQSQRMEGMGIEERAHGEWTKVDGYW